MADCEVQDNTDLFANALEEQIQKALESCGLVAEGYAKMECPVNTGNLRNSITHQTNMDERKEYVGTNVSYAPYVEFGTGIYAEGEGGGRQTPWAYEDETGEMHFTHGQRAKPFLKPAAANHTAEYQKIIKDCLKGDE